MSQKFKSLFSNDLIKKIYVPVLLSLLFLFLAVQGLDRKSHTTDEPFHTVRGVMLLKTGDFRINQHHPLLFNTISAIPLILDEDFKIPSTDSKIWRTADKDRLSEELVRINGGTEGYLPYLNRSRVLMITLSALFIYAFYQIIRKEFGFTVASMATVLLATTPTFLTHGSLVTTDAPAMFTIFFATYALFCYLRNSTKKNLAIFAVLAVLALLSKYTALTLAPVWLLAIMISHYAKAYKENNVLSKQKRILSGLVASLKIALVVGISWLVMLTAAYGFHFQTMKETLYGNQNKLENRYNNINDLGKMVSPEFSDSVRYLFDEVPFPFPQFVLGFIENVFLHNVFGHTAFFLGEFYDKGWWYYFPVSFALKEQSSTVILTVIALSVSAWYFVKLIREKKLKTLFRPKLVLIISPLVVLLLAMSSSINLGLRHIIVIYPFLFLLVGIVLEKILKDKKKILSIAAAVLVVNLISITSVYPFYLEYFNEFIGGAKNGYRYLDDSNLDWGQNRLLMREKTREYKAEGKLASANINDLKDGGYLIIPKKDLEYKNYKKACSFADLLIRQYKADKVEIVETINFTHYIVKIEPSFWVYDGNFCLYEDKVPEGFTLPLK